MNERGFSLIEVIAAMVILTIGVMGLAASSTTITRLTSQGGLTSGAAAVAASRFDILRATACGSLASGTATTGKFSESWAVWVAAADNTNLKSIADTVKYIASRRARTSVFTTKVSCLAVGP